VPGMTDEHNDRLIQFVLDGSDENETRFLLRFSEDNMNGSEGVVIGRSPGSSPYIINHLDISRKHFCLKIVKDQIFIEDLRSTNGTSLNGRAIGNKGPAAIDSGDQIIIGSVVMTLRVLSL
jgi:pSer/pThr/pTyr-binding forkhead associated (FHA) protein